MTWALLCRHCKAAASQPPVFEEKCIGILQKHPYLCDGCQAPLPDRGDGFVDFAMPLQGIDLPAFKARLKALKDGFERMRFS